MFKSLFSKYMTLFFIVILVSIGILTAVVFAIFGNYGYSIREDAVRYSGTSIQRYISSFKFRTDNFGTVIAAKKTDLSGYINLLPKFNNEMHVFITDYHGNIVFEDSKSEGRALEDKIPYVIPEKMKSLPKNDANFLNATDDLKNTFTGNNYSFVMPVYTKTNNLAGLICFTVDKGDMNQLTTNMTKGVVMAAVWVIVFGLILLYFITERIVSPLREMSNAAKEYAKGNFKRRVPVRGNDEVANLGLALNNMASTLEGSERMKTDFLSSVSHELRSPLTSINGFVDGMLDGHIPPENHEKYLGIVSTEVKRLSRLIGSLMDISRIQSGDKKFNFTDFNICETARRILISLEQKIDHRKLQVEFETDEDDMFVHADEDAIYQILYNICQNAVKFSYDGGLFRIRINEKNKKTYVSVYNEGIGIDEKDLPYVFDRFYKSDKSRGVDKTGVGLGMFLAKSIIDSHDEEIWVNSELEKYCEFVFTLKTARTAPKDKRRRRGTEV